MNNTTGFRFNAFHVSKLE